MYYLRNFIEKKLVPLITLLLFCFSSLFPQEYSGTSYGGTDLQPKIYNGVTVYPFIYEGKTVYPLSYGGTLINGVLYQGIDLSNYKITVHKISGNENSDDFYDSSVPEEYRVNWKKVIGKYAIGTTILVITGIMTVASGTVTAATVGYIAAGAFKDAAIGAATGAAIEALFSGTLAFFKGEPKEQVFKEVIEASADGFMWGALTGAIAGGIKSVKELSKGTPLLNSKGRITYVKDDKGIVYKARGGEPQGAILNRKNKKGNFEFFYDEKGRLLDFDGNVVAERYTVKRNGIVLDTNNNKVIAYIDSKGTISTGDDISAAIKSDVRDVPKNINAKYKNNKHPEAGVRYKEKIVVDEDGVKWKGVFPQFPHEYEYRLPKDLRMARDKVQFKECTKQLKAYLEAEPQMKSKFTKQQLEQIWNLDTPDGFVWHHCETPPGKMQLVDVNLHDKARHTGGKYIWGGGKAHR